MRKNINKLFPRLSISTKLVIAFLGVGVLPLLVYGVYSVWSMSQSLEEQALKQLQFQIDQTGQDISQFLAGVQNDLHYLKSLRSLKELAALQGPGDKLDDSVRLDRARSQVEQDFLRFSQGKRAYYQLRYLNSHGWELVRMNRRNHELTIVPKDDLQNKASRYYFQEGLQCEPNGIYVSDMDLNIERGIVEVPLRPVVRYATPVVDEHGNKQGLLIINIFAEAIFEIIGGVPDEAGSYLTDNDGLYLYQSAHTGALNYFRNRSLQDDYPPEVVRAVLQERSGLTDTPEFILSHSHIELSTQSDDQWVLIIAVPRQVVLASVYRLESVFLGLLLLIVGLVCFLAMAAARQFVRPVLQLARGADLIAKGNFDRRIQVETNDELEDLGGHFNTMARHLGKSQAKLQRWNEELQTEVARQTKELMISEAQLRIEKQKLDDIISSIGAELCLIDRDRKIVWVNKTLAQRCNGEDSAIGRSCYELFYQGEGACPNCHCEHNFTHRIGSNVVVSRPDKRGSERIYQIVSTPVIDLNGEVSHLLEMHMDITESVLRERALEKQSAEKKRLASQVRLSAGVIHEVAKPLAAMKTTVQVLESELPNGEQRVYLQGIESEIDQLSEFLQTFSKYARPRPLTRQPGKISDVVRQVRLLIEKDAQRRKVDICVKGLDELPEIQLDSIQLQQALLNICVNAFEAMPGGGTLTIAGTTVQPPERVLQLSISDTGMGIEADKAARIFDPFFSDKPDGTGLGLAIVKQIVTEHGGQIYLESKKGRGTKFIMTLPLGIETVSS